MTKATTKCLGVFLLVLAGIRVQADEPSIEPQLQTIRSLYREATEAGRFDDLSHSVSLNTMYPATGLRTTDITFFYINHQDEGANDPYSIEPSVQLVVVEYNISVHVEYHIEYLFDEDGHLRFCFRQERMNLPDAAPSEQRYYFSEGEDLIQAAGNFSTMAENRVETQQGRSISPDVRDRADDIRRKAQAYYEMFDRLSVLGGIE